MMCQNAWSFLNLSMCNHLYLRAGTIPRWEWGHLWFFKTGSGKLCNILFHHLMLFMFEIWSGYQCEVTLTHKTCIGINKDLMSNQHGVFFLVSCSAQGTQKAVTMSNLGRKRCSANVHGFAMTFQGNRWPRVVSWTVVMLESRLTLKVNDSVLGSNLATT